jgi:hypothetical protein
VRCSRIFGLYDWASGSGQEGQVAGELRSLRRRYLHFMVNAESNADDDARKALAYADLLVVKTLNVSYDQGRLVLPARVSQYIKDIVALEPEPPTKPNGPESRHAA